MTFTLIDKLSALVFCMSFWESNTLRSKATEHLACLACIYFEVFSRTLAKLYFSVHMVPTSPFIAIYLILNHGSPQSSISMRNHNFQQSKPRRSF